MARPIHPSNLELQTLTYSAREAAAAVVCLDEAPVMLMTQSRSMTCLILTKTFGGRLN